MYPDEARVVLMVVALLILIVTGMGVYYRHTGSTSGVSRVETANGLLVVVAIVVYCLQS